MAKPQLIFYPQPQLAAKAELVKPHSAEIVSLIPEMFEIMYQHQGIGLAAPQLGISLRLFVMDVPLATAEPEEHQQNRDRKKTIKNAKVCLNPQIISRATKVPSEEGCLSIPGIRAEITRFSQLIVRYQNQQWQTVEEELTNLEAFCFQHELDHLNGVLFWDYLPPVERRMLKKKFKKQFSAA